MFVRKACKLNARIKPPFLNWPCNNGCANKVLEVIAREVDFSEAEQQVANTYATGGRPAYRPAVLLRVTSASLWFE